MYLFPASERPFERAAISIYVYNGFGMVFGEPVLLVCIGLSPAFFGNVALYNIECYNTILLRWFVFFMNSVVLSFHPWSRVLFLWSFQSH